MTQLHAASQTEFTFKPGMTYFGGGEFRMGCDTGAPAEQPEHIVEVAPFWLDINPVTNSEFSAFCEETHYLTMCEREGFGWSLVADEYQAAPGISWRSFSTEARSNHPVVLVSWDDAHAYALWAGKRLPTETEWEFAARAACGFGGNYPWMDNEADPFTKCGGRGAWIDGPGTSVVGTWRHGAVNELVGNVWQWCSDSYAEGAYQQRDTSAEPETDNSIGNLRARRGGAWNVRQAFRLRCSNRGAYPRLGAAPNIGFRCAK